MNARELSAAITYLKPSAEYVFEEADYSTIEWLSLEGDAPTYAELQKAHLDLQEIAVEKEKELEAQKLAAQAKLAVLGLTVNDLKVLGIG